MIYVGYGEEASGGIVLGIIRCKTQPFKPGELSRSTKFKLLNPDFCMINSCWLMKSVAEGHTS